MREWTERRGEVLASVIATLHFLREKAAERRHLSGMLSLLGSEDLGAGGDADHWRYLGTWFHPHLGTWVHDLRYREREDGPRVCLRVPASDQHRPTLGREELAQVEARMRRLRASSAPPRLELIVSTSPGRSFALVVPLAEGPTVWRCVRESLFPAREEVVVLH